MFKIRSQWLLFVLMSIILLAACTEEKTPNRETQIPTIAATQTEVVLLPSDTPTSTYTPGGPSLTPSSTFPPTVTPRDTDTPQPESTAIPPTLVPEPYIHKVAEGETCGGIAVKYGLTLNDGSRAIEEANGISCRNIQIGQNLTVPRPTGTPTPQGFEVTQTAIATALPPSMRDFKTAVYDYCPVEEDTLTSIALKNGVTQKQVCEMNPLPDGLDCSGCDFSESSVGYCPRPPLISVNKCLKVPGPTHTPTSTPTFTGSETATPTPTYVPPYLFQPANGTTMRGEVILAWVSVGQLKPDEYYQVSVTDETTGELLYITLTRHPNLTIPQEWQPAAGQSRQILWKVEVVKPNAEGLHIPISGQAALNRFVWEG